MGHHGRLRREKRVCFACSLHLKEQNAVQWNAVEAISLIIFGMTNIVTNYIFLLLWITMRNTRCCSRIEIILWKVWRPENMKNFIPKIPRIAGKHTRGEHSVSPQIIADHNFCQEPTYGIRALVCTLSRKIFYSWTFWRIYRLAAVVFPSTAMLLVV